LRRGLSDATGELGQRGFQGVGCDTTYVGHDVGVGVHRLRYGGVPELMLDDIGIDVLMQQGVL
jgi:hypothetical protein